MTKEDKELLLKDLCGRIQYGVKIKVRSNDIRTIRSVDIVEEIVRFVENDTISPFGIHIEHPIKFNQAVKPYLRSMSSMTRQECTQLNVLLPRYFIVTPECLACLDHINGGIINFDVLDIIIDFYNSHHLDWRGLIPKGLALEAPKDMYKI